MELTEQERLKLWGHFRVLASTEADPTWWEFAEILRRGLAGEYYRLTEAFSEELSEGECAEVRDVLHMYVRLQQDYRQLDQPESVEEARLRFPGFDSTAETRRVTYVSFIRENLGEYEALEVDGTENHSDEPMLSKYRAMLKVFEDGRQALAPGDIREILSAGTDATG